MPKLKQVSAFLSLHLSLYMLMGLFCYIKRWFHLLKQLDQVSVLPWTRASDVYFHYVLHFPPSREAFYLVKEKISTTSYFFFKNVNNKKIFSNEALFPLSVGGHKCGLIIRPFFPELIMLTPTITEEEKQTLQSIRPLMPRFLATYFLTA